MRKTKSGFTLIELVVFLVVLGALASVAGIRMQQSSTGYRTSIDTLKTHLLYTKYLAMTSGQRAGLRFDPSTKSYEGVYVAVVPGAPNPFPTDLYRFTATADSLQTNAPSDTIYFNASGAPVDADGNLSQQTLWIRLQMDGKQEQIEIEPVTGWIE